jgi:hypothetical protein
MVHQIRPRVMYLRTPVIKSRPKRFRFFVSVAKTNGLRGRVGWKKDQEVILGAMPEVIHVT